MRTKLLDLFASSAIIQGTMALGALGAVIYLAVTGQDVPEVLVGVLMAIVGFYFGTKVTLAGD